MEPWLWSLAPHEPAVGCIPIIPPLGKERQEDQKFTVILSYIVGGHLGCSPESRVITDRKAARWKSWLWTVLCRVKQAMGNLARSSCGQLRYPGRSLTCCTRSFPWGQWGQPWGPMNHKLKQSPLRHFYLKFVFLKKMWNAINYEVLVESSHICKEMECYFTGLHNNK